MVIILTEESKLVKRLIELRLKQGVSARDMSLSLGQSESYINKIENNKSLPSITVLFEIMRYFKITPLEFFDYSNDPKQTQELINEIRKLDYKVCCCQRPEFRLFLYYVPRIRNLSPQRLSVPLTHARRPLS